MRPPFCAYCREMKPGASIVGFADFQPLPEGVVGHPHGLEWFCPEHLAEARRYRRLPVDEALRRMSRRRWWTRLWPGLGWPG